MSNDQKPQDVWQIELKANGSTLDELRRSIDRLAEYIDGKEHEVVTGDGWALIKHNPGQTKENYQREVHEYVKRMREERKDTP